ncbi:hypothetical protein RB2501_05970 [Robiginitalea biformata HTCC2501]|uniref:Uncharacterized protein n=1 Tax=Robiginitalea biformata (strain ATCC BAA-864 / DSM 15991 / KCTC 12146 / HTCC2501) TaxID=313596 RepID=A4CHL4_ROBBH|nr:hypothetical protein RB2501_05970 [Robiginitalea biformata HTCC2501]
MVVEPREPESAAKPVLKFTDRLVGNASHSTNTRRFFSLLSEKSSIRLPTIPAGAPGAQPKTDHRVGFAKLAAIGGFGGKSYRNPAGNPEEMPSFWQWPLLETCRDFVFFR